MQRMKNNVVTRIGWCSLPSHKESDKILDPGVQEMFMEMKVLAPSLSNFPKLNGWISLHSSNLNTSGYF